MYQLKSSLRELPKEFATYEKDKNGDPITLTVPGMALNIAQAIARMQAGQDVRTYVAQWTSENLQDFPPEERERLETELLEFEKMDRLDRLQWAAQKRLEFDDMLEAKKAIQAQRIGKDPEPSHDGEPKADDQPRE
jgi:hypothetical protein